MKNDQETDTADSRSGGAAAVAGGEGAVARAKEPGLREPTVVDSWPGWPGRRISLGVLALVAGIAGLSAGEALLLPILLGILLTLLLTPAVDFLERIRLPRWLGALLVVSALVAALANAATHHSAPAQQRQNPRSPYRRKMEDQFRAINCTCEAFQGPL